MVKTLRLKKLISLIACTAVLLTLLPTYAVYAEDDDSIASALKVENITSQVTGALSARHGDLTLSSCGGKITWTSSDNTLLAVEGEKGVIKTYGINVSKPVILTATYEGGSRKYNFAVAPNKWTLTTIGASGKLAEDFESGENGQTITVDAAADHKVRSGWGKLGSDSLAIPDFKYSYDESKGMVGALTGVDDAESSLSLLAGAQDAAQRFATGFDVKLLKGKLEFEMNGVLPYERLVLEDNRIDVYTEETKKESFEITPGDDGWIRVDVDTNWAARSQNIYVNGQALSDMPMKNMMYTTMNKSSIGAALRYIDIKLGSGASALIDNIAVTKFQSTNMAMADAGIKAAQLFYADKEITGKTFETYGPTEHNGGIYDIEDSFENQDGTKDSRTGVRATLTWSGDCVGENNVFAPTAPGVYNLTITSYCYANTGYGAETKTGTVTIKAAPAVIKTADGKINVTGATEGGILVIAQYDENGSFKGAATVKDNFTDITIPSGICRYFFIKNGTLSPLAFSK